MPNVTVRITRPAPRPNGEVELMRSWTLGAVSVSLFSSFRLILTYPAAWVDLVQGRVGADDKVGGGRVGGKDTRSWDGEPERIGGIGLQVPLHHPIGRVTGWTSANGCQGKYGLPP